MTAALVGTIAANAFYLTMSFYYFFAFAMLALAAPIVFARRLVKVVVLTTSYPRDDRDVAGVFVRDAVEGVRRSASTSMSSRRRRSATSASPTGTGSSGTCADVPGSRCYCPRSCSPSPALHAELRGDADLVHAHWLPSGLVALATGKPFVVQLWGTDVELARRAPWLFRPIVRRARLAIVASEYLAAAARELGAREVRVIPSPVEIPESVGEPDDPPHVLFVGRLSPEKGIHEFLEATKGCRA